jgi:putative copper export protein
MEDAAHADDACHATERGRPRVAPRFVLLALLAAALGGVWIGDGWRDSGSVVAWWTTLVAIGALLGGTYWRLVLFRSAEYEDAALAERTRTRWRRIEIAAAIVVLVAVAGIVGLGRVDPGTGRPEAILVAAAVTGSTASIGAALVETSRSDVTGGVRAVASVPAVCAIGAAAAVEVGTADPAAWSVRLLHLLAVGLWLGGALWHNAVVLPLGGPVDPGLLGQVKRFRRHLPAVVVVVLATGLSQTHRLFGTDVGAIIETRIGRVILLKIAVLVALVALIVRQFRSGGPGE